MISYYPWQERVWQHLQERRKKKKLPHAILLSGIKGMGKAVFARAFAQSLICRQPQTDGTPCNDCSACHFYQLEQHPNVTIITPEAPSQAIKIDQIRDFVNIVQGSAVQEGYRVSLIYPADAMNMAATNALLKTLEEPSDRYVMLLWVEKPHLLPATLRSRCQRIHFSPPPFQEAQKWLVKEGLSEAMSQDYLTLAEGAPLRAVALAKEQYLEERLLMYQRMKDLYEQRLEPVKFVERCLEDDLEKVCDHLVQFLKDLIYYHFTQSCSIQSDAKTRDVMAFLNQKVSIHFLYQMWDQLLEAVSQIRQNVSINKQLLLESVFIRWSGYSSSSGLTR